MNLTNPWNLLFLVGFVAYLGIRGVYASASSTSREFTGKSTGWKRSCWLW